MCLDKTLHCRDGVQHGCISSACCIVHNSTLVSSLRLPSLDTRAYRTKCKTECKNSCGLNSHGLLAVSCDSTKTTLPACTVQCRKCATPSLKISYTAIKCCLFWREKNQIGMTVRFSSGIIILKNCPRPRSVGVR